MLENSFSHCLPNPPISISGEPAANLRFELLNTFHKSHASLLDVIREKERADELHNHIVWFTQEDFIKLKAKITKMVVIWRFTIVDTTLLSDYFQEASNWKNQSMHLNTRRRHSYNESIMEERIINCIWCTPILYQLKSSANMFSHDLIHYHHILPCNWFHLDMRGKKHLFSWPVINLVGWDLDSDTVWRYGPPYADLPVSVSPDSYNQSEVATSKPDN